MEPKSQIDQSEELAMSQDRAGTAHPDAHPDGSRVSDTTPRDESPNGARRRLTKLGLGAPVLLTLASRPVLAGQCLSNMMSGNLSDPNRGQCSKGWSPGAWGNPGGMIGSYTTLGAWTKAGFIYGYYVSTCGNPSSAACYRGGSTLANVPSVLNRDALATTRTLRRVLTQDTTTLTRHLVTAYLNASLSENDANFQYILTKQQVLDLATGVLELPPGYNSLKTFLDATWQ